jgi:rhamnogalacturonan II specific xylosyltransferase
MFRKLCVPLLFFLFLAILSKFYCEWFVYSKLDWIPKKTTKVYQNQGDVKKYFKRREETKNIYSKNESIRVRETNVIAENKLQTVKQSNKTQVTDTVTTICTITALSSRGFKGRDYHTTALKLILLPSLEKTIEQKYNYRCFFGYDKGDQYWEKHKPHVEKHFDHHDNIEVNYIMITGGSYTKAVNGIAKYAHTSKGAKCDYYARVNDDAEFQSNGWTSAATTVLKNFQPSNIGAVGPVGSTVCCRILIFDMVHRSHLDIFDTYYPPALDNWWTDDWITQVYGKNKQFVKKWKMKHHTNKHGQRYSVKHSQKGALKSIINIGKKRIGNYIANISNSNKVGLQLHHNKSNTEWRVVVTVSSGFINMFENWLYYFQRLRIGKITLIAEDHVVREKYRNRLGIDTIDGIFVEEGKAHSYETKQYLQMVSKRAGYLLKVLKTYKRIIYTDIDTVWLSDPRPYFSGNSDLWMQVDAIHSGRNYYCTGFFAMIYSDAIIQLMKDWDSSLRKKKQLNQPLFNKLLKNSKVKHQGLDRKKFPSGNLYFGKGRRKGVVIVHNNFIQGYDKKVKRFKSVGLWHPK